MQRISQARGSATPSSNARRWRWWIRLVVGTLAGAALFVYWSRISVIVAIAIIAANSFPGGVPADASPMAKAALWSLHDDTTRLAIYPPGEIGKVLSFGPASWRAVACDGLASSQIDRDPAAWRDTVVVLADVALNDQWEYVRGRATFALQRAPVPDKAQVCAILEKVALQAGADRRKHVLDYLLKHRAIAEKDLRSYAERLIESPHFDDRDVGCHVLLEIAPTEPTFDAVATHVLIESYRRAKSVQLRHFHSMAWRKPEMVFQLLEGDEDAMLAALDLIRDLGDRSHPVYSRAVRTAAEALTSSNERLSAAAMAFLANWPRTMHLIAPLACSGTPRQRIDALKRLERIAHDMRFKNFRFTSLEGDRLVHCLAEKDSEVRAAAVAFFAKMFAPPSDWRNRFTVDSGPLHPGFGAIFRELANEPDESARRLAVRYLSEVASAESANAVLVAQIVTDSLGDRSSNSDVRSAFFWLTHRFADHVETERLADTLVNHPDVPVNLVVKAVEILLARGRSFEEFSGVLLPILRRHDQDALSVVPFFVKEAERSGKFTDESVGISIWKTHFHLANVAGLSSSEYLEVKPDRLLRATGPQPARAVLRDFVGSLLDSGSVSTDPERTKALTRFIAYVPDSEQIVDELIESRLTSESERVRSAAVRFAAAGGGDPKRQIEHIKVALDDPADSVCRWAIEAVLGLNKPNAGMVALLRQKAESDPVASVRAASLHAYGQLAPNDAGTREFVQSRLRDDKQVQLTAAQILKQLERKASAKP